MQPAKHFEYMRNVGFTDADPVVLNEDAPTASALVFRRNLYDWRAVRAAILDRVRNQVLE